MKAIRLHFTLLLGCARSCLGAGRPRLAVLTNVGGDPDDQQSLVRLMVYANEFDLVPQTCSTGVFNGRLQSQSQTDS